MATIQAVYSPDVLADDSLRAAAEQATATLQELADSKGPDVTAEWRLAEDGEGSATLVLELRDPSDSVTAVFHPSELAGERGWVRLNRAYRRLLTTRVHRLLSELEPLVPARAD